MAEALSVQVTAQLDAETLISTLLSELVPLLEELRIVEVPFEPSQLDGIVSVATTLDFSSLESSVADLVRLGEKIVAELPGAEDLLSPIQVVLDLIEQISEQDLEAQFLELNRVLGDELGGADDFIALLQRITDRLEGMPALESLFQLLRTVVAATGATLPSGSLKFPNVVPALLGSLRAVGGAMALESVLCEAQRLMSLMAEQVDEQTVSRAESLLAQCFGQGEDSLARAIERMDPESFGEVAALEGALTRCANQTLSLQKALRESLGFGEATLVYLDVERVRAEVGVAASQVLAADTTPLEKVARKLSEQIGLLLPLDASVLPAFSLEELLGQIELRIEEVAGSVATLDLDRVTAPIEETVQPLILALSELVGFLGEIRGALTTALGEVRGAVEGLPVGELSGLVGEALRPIEELLDEIGRVVGEVSAALGVVAGETEQAIRQVEGALDGFQSEVDQFFGGAREAVEALDVAGQIGSVAEGVRDFTDLLAQAELKPALDTAADAISTAAGVVDAVPIALLPAELKAELDKVVEPIKAVDRDGVEAEVRISVELDDGRFLFLGDLQTAIGELQALYLDLLASVGEHDPRSHLARIDAELQSAAARLSELAPDLTLEPVQQVLEAVRSAVAAVDLEGALQPVESTFDSVLQSFDELSPAGLLKEHAERLSEVREELVGVVRLRDWSSSLDQLVEPLQDLVGRFETEGLRELIETGLGEARELLDRVPGSVLAEPLGALLASLLQGPDSRVQPWSVGRVVEWCLGSSGTVALEGRIAAIDSQINAALASVDALDLGAIGARHRPAEDAVRAAVEGLPAGSLARLELEPLLAGLGVETALAELDPHRSRFAESLRQSAGMSVSLSSVGLAEVDQTLGRLRASLQPLSTVREFLRDAAARIGLPRLDEGIGPALDALLEVASPERLASLIVPLLEALSQRLETLVISVIAPMKSAVEALETAVDLIDLAPLVGELEAVHAAARAQIESLRPRQLLGDSLNAVTALQMRVADFDPLADLQRISEALTESANRLAPRLSAELLLREPLAVFDGVMEQLRALDIEALLAPLLAQLDQIAAELDSGLTLTFDAFEDFQDSLPEPGGGLSVSVDVDIGF